MKLRQNKRSRNPSQGQLRECGGLLEVLPRGFGFLRRCDRGMRRTERDVYVPENLIRGLGLQEGSWIDGVAQVPPNNRSVRLTRVCLVDGMSPSDRRSLDSFAERTPVNPVRWLRLEHPEQPMSMRILDLLCPLGLGQRALIAAPPRAGKTTLLREIGQSVICNHSDLHVVVLLVDERPEEVTEMRQDISGEFFTSNLDEEPANHVRVARMAISRCRRLAETGRDVLLLVDSLTRLARAANKLPGLRGAVGTGGLNIHALEQPKQLFAAARPFAEGGSLTIVASVLIETDNRMDEVIFREFKGTGNFDLVLNRQLAEQRVWPAFDIPASGTRRVELIQDPATLATATALRRTLLRMQPVDGMRLLVEKLSRFKTNDELVKLIAQA